MIDTVWVQLLKSQVPGFALAVYVPVLFLIFMVKDSSARQILSFSSWGVFSVLFAFAAGMIAMLILAVSLVSAVNPSFLAGYGYDSNRSTFSLPNYQSLATPAPYRYYIAQSGIFPLRSDQTAQLIAGDLAYYADQADYLTNGSNPDDTIIASEILLLQVSSPSLVEKFALPCEGQVLKMSDYPILGYILTQNQDSDCSFSLPDVRGQSPVAGAAYYMVTNGTYVYEDPVPAGNVRCPKCYSVVPDGRFCIECGSALR